VPDAYPLSLNALLAGCNQKTSRLPVMNASEADVLAAIESLKGLSLVIESSGGRVMRYAQNVKRVLQVPTESVALLSMLMLRGPQTAAELRANCERLCRFSDVSAVEAFLVELAQRPAEALVGGYAQARAAGDQAALERLLWQSPRALHGGDGAPDEASLQVRTFGRDFAVTVVVADPGGEGPGRLESLAWVRFAQGWRIVAAHPVADGRDATPPQAAQG